MTEWATANPWLTTLIVILAINLINGAFTFKSSGSDELSEAMLDYEREKSRADKLSAQYQIAKNEAERYKEMYYNNLRKTDSYARKKQEQEERARHARAKQARYDDMRRFHGNFDDLQEAMRRQTPNADEQWQKIKSDYRRHMKAIHPDKIKANGGTDVDIAEANIKAQKLNADYELAKRRFGK